MPKSTTGVFNIDKPAGPTSHDVIARVRELTGVQQVGHAGTLDPFATGILLVAIGSATRLLEYTRDLPKTYLATITLGATSDTDDRTGKIKIFSPLRRRRARAWRGEGVASREQILQVLTQFLGPIQQIPPQYSAVKVAGKRAYAQARVGDTVALKPRPVVIHSIKLLAYAYPTLNLKVICGGGTYIRALARDIGEALGTGAYVQELRRIAIGPFDMSSSVTLDELSTPRLEDSLSVNNLPILSPETLINHLPKITLDPTSVAKLQKGQGIALAETPSVSPLSGGEKNISLPDKGGLGWVSPIAIFDQTKTLIGIGKYELSTALLHPQKVL